jgi:hypothetical protein
VPFNGEVCVTRLFVREREREREGGRRRAEAIERVMMMTGAERETDI